ncbi:MAG TPA: hypothetical protein VHS09_12370 [Polyangiaceae bacterium]|nr:hypothetical protein [Polyangiaceae bacterium]
MIEDLVVFLAGAGNAANVEARLLYTARARTLLETAKRRLAELELQLAAYEAEAVRIAKGTGR